MNLFIVMPLIFVGLVCSDIMREVLKTTLEIYRARDNNGEVSPYDIMYKDLR